ALDGGSAWADYDNDGKLDFIIYGNDSFRLYHNDGGGNFHEVTIPGLQDFRDPAGQNVPGAVAWGDYDNDGYVDFFISGFQNGISTNQLWHNNGGTNFTLIPIPNNFGVCWGTVEWGDYDNDGYLDLLFCGGQTKNSSYVAQLYRNDTHGNLIAGSVLNNPSTFYPAAAWGDYDNDGD